VIEKTCSAIRSNVGVALCVVISITSLLRDLEQALEGFVGLKRIEGDGLVVARFGFFSLGALPVRPFRAHGYPLFLPRKCDKTPRPGGFMSTPRPIMTAV